MFMEAPLPGAGAGPTTAPQEPAAASPAGVDLEAGAGGASDAKGWTVFMERSPVAPAPVAQGPMGFAAAGGERSAAQGPTAVGEAHAASAHAEPAMDRGRTIIASGMQALQGPPGGITGRAGVPEQPDTMYFKRGTTEPERVPGVGGVEDVAVASRTPAVESGAGPMGGLPATGSDAMPAVSPGRSAPVAYDEPAGSNKGVLIAVGVVVVIGVVAAAILLL
jgi:hypothetical protein